MEVSRDVDGVFFFHPAEEIIEVGRQEFAKKFDEYKRLKKAKIR